MNLSKKKAFAISGTPLTGMVRVQATPRAVTSGNPTTAAVTFSSPPVVGHGIVVVINTFSATGTITSLVDNQGNTYTLVATRSESNLPNTLHIYYCPAITTTGSPFTITVTGIASNRLMMAIEVGIGISVDQATSGNGTFPTPALITTAALTGTNVFQVAEIGTGSTTIAVDSFTPAWSQETENLAGNPGGEIDSRVVTGANGTTPTASWTLNGANFWIAALAVFK